MEIMAQCCTYTFEPVQRTKSIHCIGARLEDIKRKTGKQEKYQPCCTEISYFCMIHYCLEEKSEIRCPVVSVSGFCGFSHVGTLKIGSYSSISRCIRANRPFIVVYSELLEMETEMNCQMRQRHLRTQYDEDKDLLGT